ncbi:MAG: GUN4 domain-containing protein, partial [Sphaerospermopsis kisseleviana]
ILDKLLQKDYQQRYQSAQEVLLDLNRPQIPPTVPYQHPQVSSPKKQTPPLASTPKSSRRGFLQVVGLFGGGFVLAIVGQHIFRDNSRPDYTRLQNLLTARSWKEADEETTRVMLTVAKQQWLNTESINNFPCADLRT